MRKFVTAVVVVAIAGLVGVARGDDNAGPTGTWKWTVERNGQKREQTLKLKLDGDKLTGALVGRQNRETKIEDATFKDGEVTFKTVRENNGVKTTTTYKGKITGDTLKGKIETDRDGQTSSRDWEATRSKS